MKKVISILLTLCLLLPGMAIIAEQAIEDEPSEDEIIYFGPFEAEDLRGEEPITDAYFAQAEATIVNIWATWCGPCVSEMPDLAKLSEASEGRVQVLGVLLDGIKMEKNSAVRDERAIEEMHTLLDKCEATFPVILPEDDFFAALMSVIQVVPTSFIIDQEGNLIGTYLGSRTVAQWLSAVEESLAAQNAEE